MPELLRGLSEYRYFIYGTILVVMMIFRPQGVIDRPLLDRLRGRRNEGKDAA
jgi:branched-chain amino acid transport system permease protein